MTGGELKPLNGMVLIEFVPRQERETKSGFIIAAPKHEGLPNRGTILAIADGVDTVKVGDYVLYSEERPEGFTWNDKKVIPVHIDNVLAIIEDDEK